MAHWTDDIAMTAFGAFIPQHHFRDEVSTERVMGLLNFRERWPNFEPRELWSKGNGDLRMHYETLDCLQRLRNLMGRPLAVASYYRDPAYNAGLNGAAKGSYHLAGRAVDTPSLNRGLGRVELIHLATLAGFTGFGIYDTFTHLDTGGRRYWGENDPFDI